MFFSHAFLPLASPSRVPDYSALFQTLNPNQKSRDCNGMVSFDLNQGTVFHSTVHMSNSVAHTFCTNSDFLHSFFLLNAYTSLSFFHSVSHSVSHTCLLILTLLSGAFPLFPEFVYHIHNLEHSFLYFISSTVCKVSLIGVD